MMMENKELIFLSLLSGKGGSGKTVLSLSIAKVLAEAGFKVLLVDLDTATHGATYFFESELDKNNICLLDILAMDVSKKHLLKTKDNFYFVPSTLSPEKVDFEYDKIKEEEGFEKLFDPNIIEVDFEIVIFDCQAGYSDLAKMAAGISHQNLIVLEADAVSSSALRVLHLQIGKILNRSNSWQLFNKLTEEERPIYEKVLGGTLFSSLPPIPFDWKVRASFSTCEIPSVTERKSAFGLGVLRIMKIIFKDFRNKLEEIERKTGGDWFVEIKDRLKDLEDKKAYYDTKIREKRRKERLSKTRLIFIFSTVLGGTLIYIPFVGQFLNISFSFSKYSISFFGVLIMAAGLFFHFWNLKDVRSDREREENLELINELESEMNKYRTLLATDPWLKEYSRLDESQDGEKRLQSNEQG
jgi:cellulose biosynthesis protein BcsQ